MLLFFLAAGLIFSIAIFGAGYYVWSVPEQEAEDMLSTRLRELRTHTRIRGASRPELLRREHPGAFAFLGDLVTWVGVLRRLQVIIEQADLKHRAADVFGFSLLLAALAFVVFGLAGGSLLVLRFLIAGGIGALPVMY